MLKIKILFSVILFSSMTVFAQENETDVSDTELEQFANAYEKVQEVSQASQNEMIEMVQAKGLDIDRYNKIMNAQQDPSQEVNVSDEELEKVKVINEELKKIEEKSNKKIEKTISDNSLTVERYQQILASIQQNPDLQMKLQQFLQN